MRALRGTLLLVALAVVCPSISCDRPRVEGPGRSYEFIVLEVKGQSLSVEVAADAQARTLGLMHREHMDENKGMIFIFNVPSIQKFWMRNTLIALSIAFLDDSGRILQIEDMKPKAERTPSSASISSTAFFSRRRAPCARSPSGKKPRPAGRRC